MILNGCALGLVRCKLGTTAGKAGQASGEPVGIRDRECGVMGKGCWWWWWVKREGGGDHGCAGAMTLEAMPVCADRRARPSSEGLRALLPLRGMQEEVACMGRRGRQGGRGGPIRASCVAAPRIPAIVPSLGRRPWSFWVGEGVLLLPPELRLSGSPPVAARYASGRRRHSGMKERQRHLLK